MYRGRSIIIIYTTSVTRSCLPYSIYDIIVIIFTWRRFASVITFFIYSVDKLTIMVNNISAYSGKPPADGASESQRFIKPGPIYTAAAVLAVLSPRSIISWTRDCTKNLQDLAFDNDDIQELIRAAVQEGRYINSQWCVQKPTGPWAACDAYKLSRSEWNQYAHKELRVDYYVKFAIGKTGKILLLVSAHMPTR